MARSGLEGDFAKLARIARKLDGAERILTKASKNMAQEALALIAEGFDKEKDPYGNDWAPLKDPTRGASKKTLRRLARQLAKKQERERQLLQQRINAGSAAAVRQIKSHKILQKTGRARKSYHRARADARGFKVAPGVNYLGYHQNPKAAGREARKMVPDPGRLPLTWHTRLRAVGQAVLREHFRG